MIGLDPKQTLRFVYLLLLLAFVIGFGWRSRHLSTSLRQGALWLLILLVVLTVYAYREPVARFAEPLLGELLPSRVVEVEDSAGRRELRVARSADGHFRVDTSVDGHTVRFLVDTGATGTVLTRRDAENAGIDLDGLSYDRLVDTANGSALYAGARVKALQIGPFRLRGVPVAVAPDGALTTSLLGMNVINQFRSWRVEGDRLLLVP